MITIDLETNEGRSLTEVTITNGLTTVEYLSVEPERVFVEVLFAIGGYLKTNQLQFHMHTQFDKDLITEQLINESNIQEVKLKYAFNHSGYEPIIDKCYLKDNIFAIEYKGVTLLIKVNHKGDVVLKCVAGYDVGSNHSWSYGLEEHDGVVNLTIKRLGLWGNGPLKRLIKDLIHNDLLYKKFEYDTYHIALLPYED